jgi:long-subunit fatty acid transport protein
MKLNGSGSTYYILSDGNPGNGTAIPSANAEITTLSFMSKYSFSENFDVLLGVNQNTLAASTATTSRGTYKISGKSGMGEIYGVAYSKPEIALRVELLAQPKAKMTTSTNYVPSAYGVLTIAAALAGGDSDCTVVPAGGVNFNSTLNRPETYTLNLQTGIAENTLLIGSIHKTNWSKAQIDVPTGGCSASATGSKFTDTTTTKVGVGRKLSDNWSVLASYQQETGGNKTTTSLFTVNNGYQSINLGVSYTVDNITISGGYSYTDIGDVAVVIPVSGTDTTYATYKNNSASALGLKVGVSF